MRGWPSKPIPFVVPFAPGGSAEIVARAAAAELTGSLGQRVHVDNTPGGAGNVAMAEVARAEDQPTLILGHIGRLAVNPFIFDKLPCDPNQDFKPVSLLAKMPKRVRGRARSGPGDRRAGARRASGTADRPRRSRGR